MNHLATADRRYALQRMVLFALLVVLPLLVVSSYLTAALGPLHRHDPAQAHGHQHAHGGLARHWHALSDASVILFGEADREVASIPTTPTTKTRARASLPLAPPFAAQATGLPGVTPITWPDVARRHWQSHWPMPPERPPRG